VNRFLQILFFALIVKPIALVVLGLNVRRRNRLPGAGPAVLVANHNSHLDILVLMSLYPLGRLRRLRPVAAADYFLRNRLSVWLATKIIGILPLDRAAEGERSRLTPITEALEQGQIVILFPEGSRGEPEQREAFRAGIAHIAKARSDAPIVPIFIHGLGKALPRGEALLVPFFCDIFVGKPFFWTGNRKTFMAELEAQMNTLASEGDFPEWE